VFPTKILLATDGSAEAELAARMAKTLSEKLDSELHVVYVETLPSPYTSPESAVVDPDFRDTLRKRAEGDAGEKLDEEVEKVRGMGGEIARSHAAAGRPDAEIVRVAEELPAGLVVVGSRGLGGVRRALLGSVSSSVVRHARGSVLVVRGEGGQASVDPGGPIVLAVDGSEQAKMATQAAAELSAGTGSEVHVIYVQPSPERLYGHHFYSEDIKESLLDQARTEARAFLDEQAEAVGSGGGSVAQTYLATGRPDEEIIELAEEIGAGLVVIGSRGLEGIRRALLGSVSESVLHHAHCSVMVVRESAIR
jgi:nucleotide-binding universal stress UspA family protein